MTPTAASSLELPAHLERELNVLGVVRVPSSFVRREVDWSFKTPVYDENGQPEF